MRERILDLHGRRLKLMDEFGMQMMVASLNAPAIQAIPDAKKANEIARKAYTPFTPLSGISWGR